MNGPDPDKRSNEMKCPHLADWMYKSCEASIKPYTPSQFQLTEYCKGDAHIKCPFYLDTMELRFHAEKDKNNNLMKVR
jgi:hypothetical protein